jgi:hypothetical protein
MSKECRTQSFLYSTTQPREATAKKAEWERGIESVKREREQCKVLRIPFFRKRKVGNEKWEQSDSNLHYFPNNSKPNLELLPHCLLLIASSSCCPSWQCHTVLHKIVLIPLTHADPTHSPHPMSMSPHHHRLASLHLSLSLSEEG